MKLFDFLIVPVFRSGGTALQTFISSHPGVVAIPKWDLDQCLQDHGEERLLESFQDLMLANPDARVGLVQHRFIGEHHDLDDIAQRLSKIVQKDGLIMVVREHFDAVLSNMNHVRIAQYCDYRFAKAGLFWPARVELGREVHSYLNEVERASCEPNTLDGMSSADTFVAPDSLTYARYAAIQETYERYFSPATVLDYEDVLSPDNRAAMSRLFAALGASRDFYLPFFSMLQARTRDRFLNHNGMKIFSDDVPERTVVLRPTSNNDHAVFDKATPIGRIYDGYLRDLFSEELCLVTSPSLEPSSTRTTQIDSFLRGFFYPLWRKNYEILSRVVDGFRVANLTQQHRSRITDYLESDAARFFESNPGIASRWRANWRPTRMSTPREQVV